MNTQEIINSLTSLDLLNEVNSIRVGKNLKRMRSRDFHNQLKKVFNIVLDLEIKTKNGLITKYCNLTSNQYNEALDAFKQPLRRIGSYEHGALCAIEQLLNISLVRQYNVDGYRIDGYDPINNIAYEVDEEQHFVGGVLKQECLDRQKYIEAKLGCTTVRIKV